MIVAHRDRHFKGFPESKNQLPLFNKAIFLSLKVFIILIVFLVTQSFCEKNIGLHPEKCYRFREKQQFLKRQTHYLYSKNSTSSGGPNVCNVTNLYLSVIQLTKNTEKIGYNNSQNINFENIRTQIRSFTKMATTKVEIV